MRSSSPNVGAALLAAALVCRAVWLMAILALAEPGHAVTIDWQSATVVLLHDRHHSTHHHHGVAERLLSVPDDHLRDSHHHVSVVMTGEPAVKPRADLAASTTAAPELGTAPPGESVILFRHVVAHRPHPPPHRSPVPSLLSPVLLI